MECFLLLYRFKVHVAYNLQANEQGQVLDAELSREEVESLQDYSCRIAHEPVHCQDLFIELDAGAHRLDKGSHQEKREVDVRAISQ